MVHAQQLCTVYNSTFSLSDHIVEFRVQSERLGIKLHTCITLSDTKLYALIYYTGTYKKCCTFSQEYVVT